MSTPQPELPEITAAMIRAALPILSTREAEILEWDIRAKTDPEIAEILGLAPGTIHVVHSRIFLKLQVPNRVGAVVTTLYAALWNLWRKK